MTGSQDIEAGSARITKPEDRARGHEYIPACGADTPPHLVI